SAGSAMKEDGCGGTRWLAQLCNGQQSRCALYDLGRQESHLGRLTSAGRRVPNCRDSKWPRSCCSAKPPESTTPSLCATRTKRLVDASSGADRTRECLAE